MRIAVPSNDGIDISAHFGRCRQFLVFEAQNGQVKLVESRMNGGCYGHGGASGAAEPQGHAGFVEALRDCGTVLCGGIGAGAVEALQAFGISVVQVDAAGSAERIVAAFQAGSLKPGASGMCQCQH